MEGLPRIESIAPSGPSRLIVRFDNGITKEYDCAPLLDRSPFRCLGHPGFFRTVRVDPGGYGVSWDDTVDLSEYELWTNGIAVEGEVTPTSDLRAGQESG
jgi:hypothetical protein